MRRRAGGGTGWGEVRGPLAAGRARRGGQGQRVPLGGDLRVGGSGVGRVPLGSLSRPGALVRIQNSNCPELGRHVGWGGEGEVGAADNGSFGEESAGAAEWGGNPATAAPAPLSLSPSAPAERDRRSAVGWRALRLARRAAQPTAPGQHRQRGGERLALSLLPPSRWPRGGAEAAVPPCCCSV